MNDGKPRVPRDPPAAPASEATPGTWAEFQASMPMCACGHPVAHHLNGRCVNALDSDPQTRCPCAAPASPPEPAQAPAGPTPCLCGWLRYGRPDPRNTFHSPTECTNRRDVAASALDPSHVCAPAPLSGDLGEFEGLLRRLCEAVRVDERLAREHLAAPPWREDPTPPDVGSRLSALLVWARRARADGMNAAAALLVDMWDDGEQGPPREEIEQYAEIVLLRSRARALAEGAANGAPCVCGHGLWSHFTGHGRRCHHCAECAGYRRALTEGAAKESDRE